MGTFRSAIYGYYRRHKRDLPWRKTSNPYHILVSEFMLQQTQVDRVLPKYGLFLETFPTLKALAHASPAAVLGVWSGLGYNRRALFLQRAALKIISEFSGKVPATSEGLRQLPGVGFYTANAILVFAYNKPVPVLDTNIRRVYIHFFFEGRNAVGDGELLPLIEETLDMKNPRRWFDALMDYGAMLGREDRALNKRSRSYARQSRFEGSDRQVRGRILKALLGKSRTFRELQETVPDTRLETILVDLQREGFLERKDRKYAIRS
jgi:A/G-specific adenine glycosylase